MTAALRLAAATAAALALAPAAVAAPTPPFGHAGRWITDAEGRVVVVHGWNMVDKTPPYLPSAKGFGEDDAAFLAREGFNTIRLGIVWKGLEPEPGRYDEAYLADLLATTRMLARHGILVLLDMHQDMYNERFQGEGMPDWAVRDDGLPAQPRVGFPGNYVAMPALWRAYDNFWLNLPAADGRPLQQAFGEAWRRVVERFRGEPNLIGYNLLNEPFPGSQFATCAQPEGCPAFDLALLTPFSQRVIAAIRAADPRGLVWYAPLLFFDFGSRTWHGDTGDPHAGFGFNDYCLPGDASGGGERGDDVCEPLEDRPLELAEQHSAATGDALLVTEFAANDDAATVRRMAHLMDRRMLSWQQWAYWNRDPSRPAEDDRLILDMQAAPAPPNVKPDKLAASVRPYPQVVAGTPLRWRYDHESRAFQLAWSTARADGTGPFAGCATTEVALPARVYGGAYAVEAEGAEVISLPGSAVLRLVAAPGAAEARVRVRPAAAATASAARTPRCDPRLRVAVAPRRAAAGRRTTYRFRVTAAGAPVSGATVRLGTRRTRTGPDGRARIAARLDPGLHRPRATAPAHRAAQTRIRVLRQRSAAHRRAPTVTG